MSVAVALLQVVTAWVYSHVFEYCAHRYLLHNHKRFKSVFKNHFGTHHYISRKNGMYDVAYSKLLSSKFETMSLAVAAVLHLPIALFFPFAYLTLLVSLFMYYFLHRKAHTDVEWGRRWLPWHYEHHMGKNQHLNWGVRLPLVDMLVGTHSTSITQNEVKNHGK